MNEALSEIPPILLQARPEELPYINEAVGNYLTILQVTIEPSEERAEVIAQLEAFRQRSQAVFAQVVGRRCGRSTGRQRRARAEPSLLVSWRVTHDELLVFACAVLAHLRLLEVAQVPEKARQRALKHLATFQQRYLDTLPPQS